MNLKYEQAIWHAVGTFCYLCAIPASDIMNLSPVEGTDILLYWQRILIFILLVMGGFFLRFVGSVNYKEAGT